MSENFSKASFNQLLADSGPVETWTDKAVREVHLVQTGLGGIVEAAGTALDKDHLAGTAGKLAFAAGSGFALSHFAANPGLLGLAARSAGTALGASFLLDVAGNGSNVVGAVADVWQSGRNWHNDSQVMRNSLGRFGFDALFMTAGGLAGGLAASGLRGAELPSLSTMADLTRFKFKTNDLQAGDAGKLAGLKHIPEFTDQGVLPPGDYHATWQEFTARYGYNSQRQGILASLQEVGGHVKNAGGSAIKVGGSFVTSNETPHDFDAAWIKKGVDEESLHPDLAQRKMQGTASSLYLKGDFYPDDHEFPSLGFWSDALGKNRAGEPVGTVTIDLSTMPSKPTPEKTIDAWRKSNRDYTLRTMFKTKETEQELGARQSQVDALLTELPQAVAGKDDGIVAWLGRLAEVNERTKFDTTKVAQALLDAGYTPKARVGDPLVSSNKSVYAQWLIGQCLNGLQLGKTLPLYVTDLAIRYRTI